MPQSVTHKRIASHQIDGEMTPGQEIGLPIDQTLTQDATGTLVMRELEAMRLDRFGPSCLSSPWITTSSRRTMRIRMPISFWNALVDKAHVDGLMCVTDPLRAGSVIA